MTQEHPITPPPELVQAFLRSNPFTPAEMTYEQFIATRFARWGADQELEACCKTFEDIWNNNEDLMTLSDHLRALRAYRRPNPPSLKERAMQAMDRVDVIWATDEFGKETMDDINAIRRALESLPD